MKQPATPKQLRFAAAAIGLALIATLVACGGANDQPTTQAGQANVARPNADELLSAMLTPVGPNSAAEALARLPRPASSTTMRVVSRHGGTAEVTTSDYGGLSVTTYQAVGGQLLVGVEMTSGAAPLHGMAVGMSAAEARAYLGGASELPAAPGASASYAVSTDPLAAPYQVDLMTSDGVVTGVTWSAYLD